MNLSATQLKRRPLHEELTESLRKLIVSGELQPGRKVPEKELCELYGVSRTPLREALKVLATDGLVNLEPNRGAWVSRITVEELDELFPVMGALEALAGELACKHITDDEIAQVRALHDRMFAHYTARELEAYFKLNQQIHETILAAARNATLTVQYGTLAARVRRGRYMANMTRERWDQAMKEHEDILDALQARDGGRLAVILRKHMEKTSVTLREWLLSSPDEG
ncbi:MAG: GntR family transcriptional regulator [Paracoccus sp. (in: a-proteobacteria)]|jgi:DNA-binding GntR family transcriptional regulator|uniref:GntR family transcriptional regulator n=1 Tax=Paracoccus sp. TaxID=267 RepID=UPI004057D794|tara:strand:+ start:620 stop:1297 length:678 start_codon:yes stop_codon:yes gene_type:complete